MPDGAVVEELAPANGAGRSVDLTPEERIGQLFAEIGGAAAKLKIYRRGGDGERYAGTIQVDEGLADEIEERLAALYGAGRFSIKAFVRGRCVRCVEIQIDPSAVPVQVEKPAASVSGPPAGPPVDLLSLVREAEERGRRQGAELIALLAGMQERSEARWSKIFEGMSSRPAAAAANPIQEGIGIVQAVGSLLEKWGWAPPGGGDDAAPEPEQSAGGGMLSALISAAGPAFGAKIGEAVGGFAPALLGAAASPSPALPAPAAPSPAPAAPAAPAASSGPAGKPSPGRPLTADQLAAAKRKRGA